MQNFKSFLKESNNNICYCSFHFELKQKADIQMNIQELTKLLKDNNLPLYAMPFQHSNGKEFSFKIFITDNDIDWTTLLNTRTKLCWVLEKANFFGHNDELQGDIGVFYIINTIPDNMHINLENCQVNISPERKMSLSNINKHLDCYIAQFSDFYRITGGILSLLKIKSLNVITMANNEIFPAPLKIIQNHIKSKDVIACSEELIEKGYKDYAKF